MELEMGREQASHWLGAHKPCAELGLSHHSLQLVSCAAAFWGTQWKSLLKFNTEA